MTCTCKDDSACSDCPPTIFEAQKELVRGLQADAAKSGWAARDRRELNVALGVAMDKLIALSTPRFQPNSIGGAGRKPKDDID